MKKILCLTGDYYPLSNAPGICLENIFNEFVDMDLEVIAAISYKMPPHNQIIHDGYKVNYIQTQYYQKREKFKNSRMRFFTLRLFHVLSIMKNKYTYDGDLISLYLKKLKEFSDIDTIIAVCLPIETIVAALEFARYNNKCKVICIYFDNYADNPIIYRTSIEKKMKYSKNIELEKTIFERAFFVYYISTFKNHLEQYFSKYYFKTEEIGLPLLKNVTLEIPEDIADNEFFLITFAGSVNNKNRNPELPLKMFTKLKDAFDRPIQIHFYSNGNANTIINKYEKAFPNLIKKSKHVRSNEIIVKYQKSNILLSIGNKYYEIGIPSKIFQYMATKKPIIHFFYNIKDPVVEVLKNYHPALCIDINSYGIKELEEFISQIIAGSYSQMTAKELQDNYYEYFPSVVAEKILKNV